MAKLLTIIVLLLSETTSAEVTKCVDANGNIAFSDSECNEGSTSKEHSFKPINSVASNGIHYNFENSNYRTKAFLVVNDVASKYACAKLCLEHEQCAVATYYGEQSKKKLRKKCKLRATLKNKELKATGAHSWIKAP